MRKKKKWISFVVISSLCISILFGQKKIAYSTEEPTTISNDQVILRTEQSKTFLEEDGSYSTVEFGFPIHQINSAGIWKDISFGLVENNIEKKKMLSTYDGKISVPQKWENGSPIAVIQDNKYSISMTVAFSEKFNLNSTSQAQLKNPNIHMEDAEDAMNAVFEARVHGVKYLQAF